jgi:polysaccharide deacetylase 2 family uncharacterized protein YibQ
MYRQTVKAVLLIFITAFSANLMAQSNTLLAQPASSLVAPSFAAPSLAAPYLATPSLVIIIDDLGNNLASGRRAVNLPGAITYAILPHTPQAIELATYANHVDVNKEVIIHMPMEAVGHKHMGPGGLNMHQDHQDFIHTLQAAIQALPQAKGLSNHMGSQLTSQPDRMHWLMSELSKTPFYFIDSKTTDNSAAMHAADEQNIPFLVRDIFLDHDPDPIAIDKAFKKALALAIKSGSAVLIAHPYPSTLDYLEHALPRLNEAGVVLVNASQAIAQKNREAPLLVSKVIINNQNSF